MLIYVSLLLFLIHNLVEGWDCKDFSSLCGWKIFRILHSHYHHYYCTWVFPLNCSAYMWRRPMRVVKLLVNFRGWRLLGIKGKDKNQNNWNYCDSLEVLAGPSISVYLQVTTKIMIHAGGGALVLALQDRRVLPYKFTVGGAAASE